MMGHWAFTVAVVALQQPAPPEQLSFPSGVEAVYVDVAVHHRGQPVSGLTAEDFELWEAGAPRAVEVAEGALAPVHAILALDVSSSVEGRRLLALRAAALSFLDGLGPRDRATLLTFSHHVRLDTGVGVEAAEARAALARIQAGGGTALFDAAGAAVALADRRHGRPVVIVFSDGADGLSWLSEEQLHQMVRDGGAVVHSVAVTALPANARVSVPVDLDPRGRARAGGPMVPTRIFEANAQASTQRAAGAEIPPVLKALASESGGEVWRATDDDALAPAFASVLAEVRSSYVLRFEPGPGPAGEWRALRVRVRNGRGEARARKGYRFR